MSADERPTLIAYDGSDDARHAIERAAELLPGRPFAVLHVWWPMAAPGGALLGISRAEAEGGRARLNEEAAAESARIAAEGAQLAAAAGLRTEALSIRDAGRPRRRSSRQHMNVTRRSSSWARAGCRRSTPRSLVPSPRTLSATRTARSSLSPGTTTAPHGLDPVAAPSEQDSLTS